MPFKGDIIQILCKCFFKCMIRPELCGHLVTTPQLFEHPILFAIIILLRSFPPDVGISIYSSTRTLVRSGSDVDDGQEVRCSVGLSQRLGLVQDTWVTSSSLILTHHGACFVHGGIVVLEQIVMLQHATSSVWWRTTYRCDDQIPLAI